MNEKIINMKTLEPYIDDAAETSGWARLPGIMLSTVGFGFLTHSLISVFASADLLSTWSEIGLSLLGGVIGALGLALRGLRGHALAEPVVALVIGVASSIFVGTVKFYFGFVGILVLLAIFILIEKLTGALSR